MLDKIIVLTGPTGVGKTAYSIRLAKDIDGEIVSCDSFQIYRYMDIGTAKISKEEMKGVVHHNIDIVDPDEDYNTIQFRDRTIKTIEDIVNRKKIPILVGGTGFYIHSIIYELDFKGEQSNENTRIKVQNMADKKGLDYIYDILLSIDEDTEKYIDRNNRHRIIRAYERYLDSNLKPSESLNNFRNNKKRYDFLYLVLNKDRQKLYEDINRRVDLMIESGLENEVRSLLERGYNFNMNSFKAIGYREFENYFIKGENLDSVIEEIKKSTRHYAKRQLTWFRREDGAIWIDKEDFSNEEECYKNLLKIAMEFIDDKE